MKFANRNEVCGMLQFLWLKQTPALVGVPFNLLLKQTLPSSAHSRCSAYFNYMLYSRKDARLYLSISLHSLNELE